MTTVQHICQFLDAFAPPRLAQQWDNVGLLLGDPRRQVSRTMTCLTITPESTAEAIDREVQLVVTHHPFPFHPLKRITAETVTGGMLLQLIEHRIAVFSPHTSFDSAHNGINQRLAIGLGIGEPLPLEPRDDDPDGLGSGRYGDLAAPAPLQEIVDRVKSFLNRDHLQYVGSSEQPVTKLAVACGSAGEFLSVAAQLGCDGLLTGETNFHTCLEAKALGVALLLPGHYASERFALEMLAGTLSAEFDDVATWASRTESDPLILG